MMHFRESYCSMSLPGEGNGNVLQYLPGEFHARRSQVGYSPRGHKQSDTTEAT